MKELIHYVLRFILMVAIIITCFRLYKNGTKITLNTNDHSMDPKAYTPGDSYKINTSFLKLDQFKKGDVVAYGVPNQSDQRRIARVVALQGQIVEVKAKGLWVDGEAVSYAFEKEQRLPPFRIPRGCIFVLADIPNTGLDSLQLGPLPVYALIGKLD